MTEVTAIVLCGGGSRRFGGGDKTRAGFGGEPLLARIVRGLPGDWAIVCAGPERPLPRDVDWVREEPPGGGPVAGIAAGLARVHTPYVVLLAGDLPFCAEAAPALVADLRTAEPKVDGVRARDAGGEEQALLAAYRTERLAAVVPPGARDVSVRRTLAPLACRAIDVPALATQDVDTVDDLRRLADQAERHGT